MLLQQSSQRLHLHTSLILTARRLPMSENRNSKSMSSVSFVVFRVLSTVTSFGRQRLARRDALSSLTTLTAVAETWLPSQGQGRFAQFYL